VADISRVAFFHGVKRDARAIGRNRRKNSIGDLFLARAIEIGDVDGIVAFERDVLVARKCGGRRGSQGEGEQDYSFHGRTIVMKKVAASAAPITIR
jgi:hypothetical protein